MTSKPSLTRSATARRMVARLTPVNSISARSVGIGVSGSTSRTAIRSRSRNW
nr:hypothetical protein [Fodinicola feengrottensis]